MKANRKIGLKYTLQYEGGYVNDPRDPGGETNKGITIKTARGECGYHGDMRTIPDAVVEDCYMKRFWVTPYYNADAEIAGVDISVFDFGVHSGPSRAGQYLKQAKTAPDSLAVIHKLNTDRLGFLKRLKIWPTYAKGFTSRVTSLEAKATRLHQESLGKPAEQVQKELNKKSEQANTNLGKEIVKGAGTGGAGGAAHQTVPDPTGFDWSLLVSAGKWVLVAGIVVAVGIFAYRAYIQWSRAEAFKREALEVKA